MEITPEKLELAQMLNSFSTLILLFLGLRLFWQRATEAIRTAYIGLQLLSSRKRYECEVNDRLNRYATAGSPLSHTERRRCDKSSRVQAS